MKRVGGGAEFGEAEVGQCAHWADRICSLKPLSDHVEGTLPPFTCQTWRFYAIRWRDKGKERKEKERKGKESKGKERKERKGKGKNKSSGCESTPSVFLKWRWWMCYSRTFGKLQGEISLCFNILIIFL